MIYTIGWRQSYDGVLEGTARERFIEQTGHPPQKKGRDLRLTNEQYRDGYPGGSVWPSVEAVKESMKQDGLDPKQYGIYGVKADWDEDTTDLQADGTPLPEDVPWRYLVPDAELVALDEDTPPTTRDEDTPPTTRDEDKDNGDPVS